MSLQAARQARGAGESRLLYKIGDAWKVAGIAKLPELVRAGDVLVVNDSATLPASLRSRDGLEVRLMGRVRAEPGLWNALVLGSGDWRMPTEHRAFPRPLAPGERLRFAGELRARVERISEVSEAWVQLRFETQDLVGALVSVAKPIQYSYLNEEAPLYQMQTPVSARPWSVEMPSAARPLTWELLDAIAARGAEVVPLTHGCGISSSGDPRIDRRLPLEEEYEIPAATALALKRAPGRVIAVGTSVVRALESSGGLAGRGWTGLRLGPESRLRVVDGLLTGLHEPGASHFELLRSFASRERLSDAIAVARSHALLTHELGDSMLIFQK